MPVSKIPPPPLKAPLGVLEGAPIFAAVYHGNINYEKKSHLIAELNLEGWLKPSTHRLQEWCVAWRCSRPPWWGWRCQNATCWWWSIRSRPGCGRRLSASRSGLPGSPRWCALFCGAWQHMHCQLRSPLTCDAWFSVKCRWIVSGGREGKGRDKGERSRERGSEGSVLIQQPAEQKSLREADQSYGRTKCKLWQKEKGKFQRAPQRICQTVILKYFSCKLAFQIKHWGTWAQCNIHVSVLLHPLSLVHFDLLQHHVSKTGIIRTFVWNVLSTSPMSAPPEGLRRQTYIRADIA